MRWSCTRFFSSIQPKPSGNLQPTNAINNRRETILLYRALLRQCTYLPDPAAQEYMRFHIVERFRAYQPFTRDKKGRRVRQKIKKQDPSKALKGARKGLKYLQRANDGHMPHLQTVLDMTYGRVGKRCRQLMAKLQAPASPIDAPLVTLPAEPAPVNPVPKRKVPRLSDELQALLKSQVKQDSSRFQGAPVKAVQPNVPQVNSWGRPFPQNRKANFIRKWYATTMERLMPPLSAYEWERLRGLASGEIRWDGPVPRRRLGTTAAEIVEAGESSNRPLAMYSHVPHRLTSSTARIVEKGRHRDTNTNPHELTPRLMRGMWSRVFQKCPRLDWSDEKGKWVVTWGRMGKQADLVFDAQKEIPNGMFDGVDEDGKILSKIAVPDPEDSGEPKLAAT
ncbi:MAG: hypothetical protein LQ341_004894 [Variospora aurantia]|nr:MAG: hypothetical protein LQ341_004894 [Variospora aurantia]